MSWRTTIALLLLVAPARLSSAAEATAPQGTTISIYDVGFALVSELRRVTLAPDDDMIYVRPLPARLDPTTVAWSPVAGAKGFDVLEQRFEYDMADASRLLARYRSRNVTVRTEDGTRSGPLLGIPSQDGTAPLVVGATNDAAVAYFSLDRVREMLFPRAARDAFIVPTLVSRIRAAPAGPQAGRLSYRVGGIEWRASHEVVLTPDARSATLATRIGIVNGTGGRFQDARVRLVSTEKGLTPAIMPDAASRRRPDAPAPALRYAYGSTDPDFERTVASLAPVQTYELPANVTLDAGETAYVSLVDVASLPVTRFFVYDGVRFDRYQRNRRNDWNYGTEFHSTVETHLEFENHEGNKLGIHLPPGILRLYQQRDDGALDFLGEDFMQPVPAGQRGHALLGPARGLTGERERTGFAEIRPLHEYEETFEIRLVNNSGEDAQVRVVEHLYRWPEYEIVKADADFKVTGPQMIEFRPDLKAGAKRSIHYTVRYRW